MAEPTKVDLTFDLGINGGSWTFSTLEEFEAWIDSERKAWSWLEENQRLGGGFAPAWNQISSLWNEPRERILRVRQSKEGSPERTRWTGELASWVKDVYARQRLIHSSTARAQYVDELRKNNPSLAVHALNYYLGSALNNPAIIIEGITLAILRDYGIHDTALTEKHAVEMLRLLMQAETAKAHKDFSNFSEKTQALQEMAAANITENQTQFQGAQAANQKTFDAMMEKSRADLANFEKTYDAKLALHAAVKYWGIKAESHKKLAIRWGEAVLAAFVIVMIALCLTIFLVVGSAKITDVELWKIGLIAIIATVGVWVIRVLVRLLLSNLHLFSDASERKTMMHAYLALLRKGRVPNDEENKLILQVLFRPTATGLVKDDATPPFMAEWLKRITGHDE